MDISNQEEIEKQARNLESWLNQAKELKDAGDALQMLIKETAIRSHDQTIPFKQKVEFLPLVFTIFPSLMLYGFSLENLLKGILISQIDTKPYFKDNGKLDIPWGENEGHNLVALAQKAKITLSMDEKRVLNQLAFITESGGRYPVPLRAKAIGSKSKPGKVLDYSTWSDNDTKVIAKMYLRFRQILLEENIQEAHRQAQGDTAA